MRAPTCRFTWVSAATHPLYGRHRREDAAALTGGSCRAEEDHMTTTTLGFTRRQLVQAMGGSAALFGVAGVLTPRALEAAYGIPPSPHTTQLLRLFGSRMLALAAWTFTAKTKEETDRVLAVAAAMGVLDVLTALAAAPGTGRGTTVRAAGTSAFFAALAVVVRSLED